MVHEQCEGPRIENKESDERSEISNPKSPIIPTNIPRWMSINLIQYIISKQAIFIDTGTSLKVVEKNPKCCKFISTLSDWIRRIRITTARSTVGTTIGGAA